MSEKVYHHQYHLLRPDLLVTQGIKTPEVLARNQDEINHLRMQLYGAAALGMANMAKNKLEADRHIDEEVAENLIRRYWTEASADARTRWHLSKLGRIAGRRLGIRHFADVYYGEHFIASMNAGSDAILSNIRTVLPPTVGPHFETREEALSAHSPSIELAQTTGHYNDEREQFEHDRHALLAAICSDIRAISQQNRPHAMLESVQLHLNNSLFTLQQTSYGPRMTTPHTFYALHNNRTNGVERISEGRVKHHLKTEHIKQHGFAMREIPGVGHVYLRRRVKSETSAATKILSKSLTEGEINLPDQLGDIAGLMMIVEGKDDMRDEVMMRTLQSLADMRGFQGYVPDEKPDGRGGNGQMPWRRIRAYLSGKDIPIEMIFFGLQDFLNYRFQIEPKSTHDKALAHPLFVYDREVDVFKALHPRLIYGDIYDHIEAQGATVDAYIAKHRKYIVRDLRNAVVTDQDENGVELVK